MRSPPDDEEFRRATIGVEPIAAPRRAALPRARPAPVPQQTRLDERAALAESLCGPLSLDDAHKMVASCQAAGVVMATNHHLPASPTHAIMKFCVKVRYAAGGKGAGGLPALH